MTDTEGPTDLTACPRCDKAPLTASRDGYRCVGCKAEFPSVAGIPWLFADPDASIGEWRNRLQFALQQLATKSQRMRAAQALFSQRAPGWRMIQRARRVGHFW